MKLLLMLLLCSATAFAGTNGFIGKEGKSRIELECDENADDSYYLTYYGPNESFRINNISYSLEVLQYLIKRKSLNSSNEAFANYLAAFVSFSVGSLIPAIGVPIGTLATVQGVQASNRTKYLKLATAKEAYTSDTILSDKQVKKIAEVLRSEFNQF